MVFFFALKINIFKYPTKVLRNEVLINYMEMRRAKTKPTSSNPLPPSLQSHNPVPVDVGPLVEEHWWRFH